jgi:hypothetical protein
MQGTRLEDGEETYQTFCREFDRDEKKANVSEVVYAYRGRSPPAYMKSPGPYIVLLK